MSTYRIAINSMALTEKLPKGDPRWETFNTSFQNKELDLMEIANAVYMGHAYTAWHNGRRCTENFLSAQFVAVDLETHDERSALATLAKMEFVKVYGGMIYTTPSHTGADPRSRILFFLDQAITNADAYKSAIEFIYSLFPSDPNCVKASGFFYGSRHCQIELVNKVLPLAHLRAYYKRWQKTGPVAQPIKTAPTMPPQQTQPIITKPHAEASEEQKITDALQRINPWSIDYPKWVAILGALHDEFGTTGMMMAEQWAQAAPGEIKRMWKSFDRFQGKRAGLGTVLYAAKGH